MACGCKKNRASQPVQQAGTNINTSVSLKNVQSNNYTLTEDQKKQIDAIVDKINKINQ